MAGSRRWKDEIRLAAESARGVTNGTMTRTTATKRSEKTNDTHRSTPSTIVERTLVRVRSEPTLGLPRLPLGAVVQIVQYSALPWPIQVVPEILNHAGALQQALQLVLDGKVVKLLRARHNAPRGAVDNALLEQRSIALDAVRASESVLAVHCFLVPHSVHTLDTRALAAFKEASALFAPNHGLWWRRA
jgi:hypothetical protein